MTRTELWPVEAWATSQLEVLEGLAVGSSKAKPLEACHLGQLRPSDQPPIAQEASVTKTLGQERRLLAGDVLESS